MRRHPRSDDLPAALSALARTATRLCGANDALIFRAEGDQLRLMARHGSIRTTRRVGDTVARRSLDLDRIQIFAADTVETRRKRLTGLDHDLDEVAGQVRREVYDFLRRRTLNDQARKLRARSEIGPLVEPANLKSDLVHRRSHLSIRAASGRRAHRRQPASRAGDLVRESMARQKGTH